MSFQDLVSQCDKLSFHPWLRSVSMKIHFTYCSEVTVDGAALSYSTKPCTYPKPTGKDPFRQYLPPAPLNYVINY